MKNNNTQEDKVTVSEIIIAVDAIARAVRTDSGKIGVIAALSDRFNPEMVSTIGTVNDNYSDTLEKMRVAFGIREEKVAFCN
tara:strand:+ start:1587 stop:1832 length:246 start_codon:yes stop_codon:yes gene_type:complete